MQSLDHPHQTRPDQTSEKVVEVQTQSIKNPRSSISVLPIPEKPILHL